MAASESDGAVRLAVEEGLATITLDRPGVLNAIDARMAGLLTDALAEATGRAEVRAILIRAEGRAFCAGGDLATLAGPDAPAAVTSTIDRFHPAIRRLRESGRISIAAVQGAAAGAGLSLMLACDLAIAADDARFSLAYTGVGATLDGGASWFLPRLLGTRRALALALLPERIDAAEALRLGLVNRVVPRDALDAEAAALGRRLAAGPGVAFAHVKRLVEASLANALPAQLDAERAAFAEAAGTADFTEGVAAFLAKRPPVFAGR